MSVFCTIQHDENGVASVILNALKAALLDPRHAAAEADALTIRYREAVRDAIIADALHLFTGANDDDDNGLSVSMSASWPALCTKLHAAPAALEGPTRFSGGQIFKSPMREKVIACLCGAGLRACFSLYQLVGRRWSQRFRPLVRW